MDGIEIVGVRDVKARTGYLQHPEQIHGQWFTPDLFQAGQEEFDVDFDEIVGLPLVRQATEAAAAGRHNILYIGPAGTGKTMAAQVMAKELDLELFRVNLSAVVSKYVGETEKNLNQIFDEASKSLCILFFDEADVKSLDASLAAKAYNEYAVCLLAKGDYENASQACESGLTYNDRDSDAALSFNLIFSYYQQENWEDDYTTATD